MLFPKQTSNPFNKASIENLKENQIGVYGLFKAKQWIYVGRGDIRQRLLDHFNGDNACIIKEGPTHWVDELTTASVSRGKALILEFTPTCNQRVG